MISRRSSCSRPLILKVPILKVPSVERLETFDKLSVRRYKCTYHYYYNSVYERAFINFFCYVFPIHHCVNSLRTSFQHLISLTQSARKTAEGGLFASFHKVTKFNAYVFVKYLNTNISFHCNEQYYSNSQKAKCIYFV